jgi:hypothetical protein
MSRKYVVFGTKKFPAKTCCNCHKKCIGIYHGKNICMNCLKKWKNGNKIEGFDKNYNGGEYGKL